MKKRFANAGLDFDGSADAAIPGVLEAEVRTIYRRSPYYGRRFPIHPDRLRWSCFQEIPLLTKQDIVEDGHCAFFQDCGEVEQAVRTRALESETTSGTTAAPMTVIMERGWWDAQTRRAYEAHPLLRSFATGTVRKAVLAPVNCSSNLCPYEDFPFPNRYVDGTVYLNLSSDPFCFSEAEWDRIAIELVAVKPDLLEGEPVYLSLLARAMIHRKVSLPSLKAVILTYGKASQVHGRRISRAFPVPQIDLYGSTEAGYLFIGDAFQDNSQAIDANAFIELEPFREDLPGVYTVIATTRGREAMPLLRYRTGDVVESLPHGYRLLGRERDLVFANGGRLVTVSAIDAVIPTEFECWHYCLTQVSEQRWNFEFVSEHPAPENLESLLVSALGGDVRVNVYRRRLIRPAASGKFTLLKAAARN
ncbi:MAG: CoF synthetase [Opitutaceae bacterium]